MNVILFLSLKLHSNKRVLQTRHLIGKQRMIGGVRNIKDISLAVEAQDVSQK
jgi:hypothetical protein